MRLNVVSDLPWDVRADVLAVAVPNDRQLPEYVTEIDRRLDGAIEAMRTLGAIKGAIWEARLIPGREMGARFVLAVGIGDGQKLDRMGARRLGGVIVRKLMGCHVEHLAVHVPDTLIARGGIAPAAFVEQVVRGLVEGAEEPSTIYLDPTDKLPPALDDCTIVVESGDEDALLLRAERGQTIGSGTNRTRRLAQRAANDVSPEVLADEASMIAQQFGMELTVIGPEEAARMGMGMFMAVGRGSANQPRFIALRSGQGRERDERDRLVALIGKGVTFDSGGISIKPSERMDDMKMDKTGACTVLHAIATVAQLAPGLPLLAVAPAVENMPGPHSSRPGDVVTALNGKAVEITNTDAEGRLILGDAMTWAERQGATHIVDIATLTGAVSRALGRSMTGGFGDGRRLVERHGLGRDAPRGASLAPAARRRLPRGHGLALRRPRQLRHGGRLPREERGLPAGVRDQALGPSRHRRQRLPPQGGRVDRPWLDRDDACGARRALPRRVGRADVDARGDGPGPLLGLADRDQASPRSRSGQEDRDDARRDERGSERDRGAKADPPGGEQQDDHERERHGRDEEPDEEVRQPGHEAEAHRELEIAHPEGASEQLVGHPQQRWCDDRGDDPADEAEALLREHGIEPRHEQDRGVHDERQRDEVRQEHLVEVGREQHDERGDVDPEHEDVARVVPTGDETAERGRAGEHDRGRAPVDRTDRAVGMGRPARGEPVGRDADEGAADRRRRARRASPCRRSLREPVPPCTSLKVLPPTGTWQPGAQVCPAG